MKMALLDGPSMGLHRAGRATYHRAMIECSKEGDTEGVVALLTKAREVDVMTPDTIHIAIRACVDAGEMERAGVLGEEIKAVDAIELLPQTTKLLEDAGACA